MILRSYSHEILKFGAIALLVTAILQMMSAPWEEQEAAQPSPVPVVQSVALERAGERAVQPETFTFTVSEIPAMEPAAGLTRIEAENALSAVETPDILALWFEDIEALAVWDEPIKSATKTPKKQPQDKDVARIQKDIAVWKKHAQTNYPHANGNPKIVIIIDDLGLSHTSTKAITELPGPLTLAFLPYGDSLNDKTAFAKERGHELIIHVPMQPINDSLDPGPIALTTAMSREEFLDELDMVFTAFDGYVGINNHMGSKLTQDQAKMDLLMTQLKERGLLFVDSKTIGASIAADTARNHFVPFAERHVFLDHYESYESVVESLALTEQIAKANGLAVAIGHPKRRTIKALTEWLPTLKDKGFDLVPVSAVVTAPEEPKADISTKLVAHTPHDFEQIEPAANMDAIEAIQAARIEPSKPVHEPLSEAEKYEQRLQKLLDIQPN